MFRSYVHMFDITNMFLIFFLLKYITLICLIFQRVLVVNVASMAFACWSAEFVHGLLFVEDAETTDVLGAVSAFTHQKPHGAMQFHYCGHGISLVLLTIVQIPWLGIPFTGCFMGEGVASLSLTCVGKA